jgi:glycosyltransferase involved in cell wall biosynthesis
MVLRVNGNGDRPALSVVVMGYRNAATIARAVASVVSQQCRDPIEVIVVISGNDGSAEAVRARFPAVRVIDSKSRLTPGAARNAGVAVARGDVVAFLAGDCVAEPGWIEGRLQAHRKGHLAVASAVTNAGPMTASGWGFYYTLFHGRHPARVAGQVVYPDAAGHGISIDRTLLGRLGPFREDVLSGEDTDLTRRLAESAIPVWYEPSVRTGHRGPQGFGTMLRDMYARGTRRATALPIWPWERNGHRSVTAQAARMLLGRMRGTVAGSWAYGPEDRRRVLASLPALVAGSIAFQVGWIRQKRRTVIPMSPRPETFLSGKGHRPRSPSMR